MDIAMPRQPEVTGFYEPRTYSIQYVVADPETRMLERLSTALGDAGVAQGFEIGAAGRLAIEFQHQAGGVVDLSLDLVLGDLPQLEGERDVVPQRAVEHLRILRHVGDLLEAGEAFVDQDVRHLGVDPLPPSSVVEWTWLGDTEP